MLFLLRHHTKHMMPIELLSNLLIAGTAGLGVVSWGMLFALLAA
ncbi:MAG: hypothetical protein ACE5FK_04490 [Candidatus Methylomirabilia bacterium]